MTTFEIEVQDDHLQRISQVRKPILAIAELIWNAVDADADKIVVTLVSDPIGGLTSIEVSDNGHGIPHEERFENSLEIVEWRMPTERRLFFCNHEGFPLDETVPGIHAAGFEFTAYMKSDYFAKLVAENRLEIANLDAPTSRALESATPGYLENNITSPWMTNL